MLMLRIPLMLAAQGGHEAVVRLHFAGAKL